MKCPKCLNPKAKYAEDNWHIWCPNCEAYYIP